MKNLNSKKHSHLIIQVSFKKLFYSKQNALAWRGRGALHSVQKSGHEQFSAVSGSLDQTRRSSSHFKRDHQYINDVGIFYGSFTPPSPMSALLLLLSCWKLIDQQSWIWITYVTNKSMIYLNTLTEAADLGSIPLFWRPQGPQGCLEKRNCPLSLNLAVWCAKIGLKS